jgi:hypothetical protein
MDHHVARRRARATRLELQLEPVEPRILQSVVPIIALGRLRQQAQAQPLDGAPTPTPIELKRIAFTARFNGNYAEGPGRNTNQSAQIYIKAAGNSSQFRHGSVQLGIFVPTDPTQSASGLAQISDKNVATTGSEISMDLAAVPGAVDAKGRPTEFKWTVNNNSAGVYLGSTGQGTLQIRYFPSGHHLHAGFTGSTGLIFRGQITTTGVANITI